MHSTQWTFTQENRFWPSIENEGELLERLCQASIADDAQVMEREKDVERFEHFLSQLDQLKRGHIDPETLPAATNDGAPVEDYKDVAVEPYHAYLRLDRDQKTAQWTLFKKNV